MVQFVLNEYLLYYNMKRKTVKLILILCLGIYSMPSGIAQDDIKWSSVSEKNSISFNVAGTTPFIGITYEHLISNRFNFEAGLGVYSIGVAIKYFPFPVYSNKMALHLVLGTNLFSTPFDTFGSGDFSSTNYLALGLSYFGQEGFNFGIGIGPSINYDFTFKEIAQSFYGNLKLGYRF